MRKNVLEKMFKFQTIDYIESQYQTRVFTAEIMLQEVFEN